MNRDEILQRLIPVIQMVFHVRRHQITEKAHLADDLHAASLDHLTLLMDIEVEFDIKISDAEAENALTVGKIIDLIAARV